MVTGIETAGLVLAVLPLVVSAAKSYREGLRTIRGFLQFRELLKNLIHDLEVEQQKFQLTCEMLLANVIDTEKAHLLIENAVSSQGWDDEQLKRKLKARLGDSLTVYLDTVQDLSESLTAMGSIVGLDDRGNATWIDEKGRKKQWKKLKTSLSESTHIKLLGRISKTNDDLDRLTRRNLELAPLRLSKKSEPYQGIREHAKSLYRVLGRGWRCKCTAPHNANLQLDPRNGVVLNGDTSATEVQFKIIFTTQEKLSVAPWKWCHIEVETIKDDADDEPADGNLAPVFKTEKTTENPVKELESAHHHNHNLAVSLNVTSRRSILSQTLRKVSFEDRVLSPLTRRIDDLENTKLNSMKLQQIQNLCSTFAQVLPDRACLGVLTDSERRHHLYSVPKISISQRIVSLNELLALPKTDQVQDSATLFEPLPPPNRSVKWTLSMKDRLQLAATFASTVLQLHGTPWLHEKWGKEDIFFLRGTEGPLVDSSYVSRSFSCSNDIQESSDTCAASNTSLPEAFSLIQNKSIFALGVVLIELCFGRTLEDLREAQDEEACGVANADYVAARRLSDIIYKQEAGRYSDAVRRCIRCEFDQTTANLDDVAFRRAVYRGVIAPLEDISREFSKRDEFWERE